MPETQYLLLIAALSIGMLLVLVIRLKVHAFISLLLVSALMGLAAGMPFSKLLETIQTGMGSILGFIAIIVGLGAIMGKMLEVSGGAEALAGKLIDVFGVKRSSWALVLTGFIIAIPVFLDVGFIILIPVVYALSARTGLSTLHYAIPLLAGLAVAHAFIPPTPGPSAVAVALDVPVGWMIMFGIVAGIPAAIIAGPIFGRYIGKRMHIKPPDFFEAGPAIQKVDNNTFYWALFIITLPLTLIIVATVTDSFAKPGDSFIIDFLNFIGHPFSALTIAVIAASVFLYKKGFTGKETLEAADKSLAPAGLIILVTGAGGVFKEVLVESGVGKILAETLSDYEFAPIVIAYLLAAVIRVTQGSATVAMVTAAGMMAPVAQGLALDNPQKALLGVAIAAGATILSHVNDSGFWLVSKLIGISEKQTLRSWTVMETIISVVGFAMALLLSWMI